MQMVENPGGGQLKALPKSPEGSYFLDKIWRGYTVLDFIFLLLFIKKNSR